MIRYHLVLTQQRHTRHDSANAPKTCACVRNVFNSSLISNKCIDRHFIDAFVDMKRVLVVIFFCVDFSNLRFADAFSCIHSVIFLALFCTIFAGGEKITKHRGGL